MKKTEIQKRKTEVTTDIICDCCGKSCKVYEAVVANEARLDHGEIFQGFEFMELEAHWGYDSGKDCEKWTAHVCEKCVDEKFSFINFKKEEY